MARVESDATTFRPLGELIYSYTRPSPSPVRNGKGKGVADTKDLDPESEDTIVFEVYHVSVNVPIRARAPTSMSGDVEHTWVQRISSEDTVVHPFVY